jgi:hypothetical protein
MSRQSRQIDEEPPHSEGVEAPDRWRGGRRRRLFKPARGGSSLSCAVRVWCASRGHEDCGRDAARRGPWFGPRCGDTVTLRVANALDEDTSIHWHGILLPANMDGVPGLSFDGIRPGESYLYRFQVRQAGTYWYHSHSGFQEQRGVYGPLIIESREPEPFRYDRGHVVMLSAGRMRTAAAHRTMVGRGGRCPTGRAPGPGSHVGCRGHPGPRAILVRGRGHRVTWQRKFFGTADAARAAGEGTGGARLAVGLRLWL